MDVEVMGVWVDEFSHWLGGWVGGWVGLSSSFLPKEAFALRLPVGIDFSRAGDAVPQGLDGEVHHRTQAEGDKH